MSINIGLLSITTITMASIENDINHTLHHHGLICHSLPPMHSHVPSDNAFHSSPSIVPNETFDTAVDKVDEVSIKRFITISSYDKNHKRSAVWNYFKTAMITPQEELRVKEHDPESYWKLQHDDTFICVLCYNNRHKPLRRCIQKLKSSAPSNAIKHLKRQHDIEIANAASEIPYQWNTASYEQTDSFRRKSMATHLQQINWGVLRAVRLSLDPAYYDKVTQVFRCFLQEIADIEFTKHNN